MEPFCIPSINLLRPSRIAGLIFWPPYMDKSPEKVAIMHLSVFDPSQDLFDSQEVFEPLYNERWLPKRAPAHAVLSAAQIAALTEGFKRARHQKCPTEQDIGLVRWMAARFGMLDPDSWLPPVLETPEDCQSFLFRAFSGLFQGVLDDESDGLHFVAGDLLEAYVTRPGIAAMLHGDLVNCVDDATGGRANWQKKEKLQKICQQTAL